MSPKFHTTAEAAEILGVSVPRIWALARSRGIARRGRDWIFTPADIKKMKPGPNGRPPKPKAPG